MSNKDEKAFQSYFMKIAKPMGYRRTSLSSGGGFPDVLGFHGERHSLVELKDLILGKKGDRLLRQFFEESQPPWYMEYFKDGGKRLFIAFRIRDAETLKKWYGLLPLTPSCVMKLVKNELRYSDLRTQFGYEEYDVCKEMIKAIEFKPGYILEEEVGGFNVS